jgi:hypothetical protein
MFRYILLAVTVNIVISCSPSLQTYDLSQEYATSLHYQPPAEGENEKEEEVESDLAGVPARSFYGGDLKRGAIWWAGKNIYLEKGDVFTYTFENIGPDSTPYGATFPPIDLVTEPLQIKITARAENNEGKSPTMVLMVGDADGYLTNATPPTNTIENSSEFKEYFFDMRNIYMQNTPKKHKVNGKMINTIKVFINPGQAAYTGQIFIKEIKVVQAPPPEKK